MFSSSATQEVFNENVDELWNREPEPFHHPFIRLQSYMNRVRRSCDVNSRELCKKLSDEKNSSERRSNGSKVRNP
ncbi:hypothetical protein CEXT_321081 [Caerostris extrusa]|uniref:Uncharacterized protein n=1 Tax=Caerostris extrusa TaxID=172846 RepID=A0AAV4NSK2_CAEEX|nr:hypothetical protein CEXT_321081 [Caerostris extrusa]